MALKTSSGTKLENEIVIKEYVQNYMASGTFTSVTFQTSVPVGYELIGYIIYTNGYASGTIIFPVNSSNTNFVMGVYSPNGANSVQLVGKIKGIYKKI